MIKRIWGLICRLHYGEYGGVGSTVSTGDAITAAKMNLKLEDVDDADLGTITEIILVTGTNPAGTNIFIGADNTNDIRLNAKSGGEISFSIAGTDAVEISATEVEITAGVDIQFLGNDGILDSNGNEVILIEAVGSAINYLNVKNAATGDPIILECLGTADRGFILQADNDEEILILTPVAGADTELTILSANAGSPIIRSSGTADKGVIFQNAASEPTFQVAVPGSAPVNWLTTEAGDTGVAVVLANDGEDDVGFEFHAKNGEEILILDAATAAANEVTITSGATGTPGIVKIEATGDDTHIALFLSGKGTGLIALDADADTGFYSSADDTIDIYVNDALDFVITANVLTLQGGSEIAVENATNHSMVFCSRNTMAYTDTTNKTLFVIPANADIIDVICHVTTAFDGSGTDRMNVGTTSGDPDEFVDSLACQTEGINRCGDASDMPHGARGDVGGGAITVLGKYVDQNSNSANGLATIEIWWTIS